MAYEFMVVGASIPPEQKQKLHQKQQIQGEFLMISSHQVVPIPAISSDRIFVWNLG